MRTKLGRAAAAPPLGGRGFAAYLAVGAIGVAIVSAFRDAPEPAAVARGGEAPADGEKAVRQQQNYERNQGGDIADGRGRDADHPAAIPGRGWKDIALRVYHDISQNNLGLVSAGVAFYGLLAIFPSLAAMVSLYGLFAVPGDVNRLSEMLGSVLPGEANKLVGDFLTNLTSKPAAGLSLAAISGLALTLWSAHSGASALMTALNITHDEEERRGFIKSNLIALGFTVGAILFIIIALALIAILPAVLAFLPLGDFSRTLADVARWPLLMVLAMAALAVLYRYGPSRDQPKWSWVSAGAALSTVLWIVASLGFSYYTTNFGSYDKTYGSIGAVIVLMMWLYISAYIVLIGAELNAESEHQTARDTTRGPPDPMGRRRAVMADTLGRSAQQQKD